MLLVRRISNSPLYALIEEEIAKLGEQSESRACSSTRVSFRCGARLYRTRRLLPRSLRRESAPQEGLMLRASGPVRS
jgi:hypothetical protein